MVKTKKGKCILNVKLREKYPFIEETTTKSDVLCKICHSRFSIASSGNTDIVQHVKSKKHIAALNVAATSQTITSHFSSTLDAQKAALEGVWAYHVVNANQSFKSSDCATKIFKTCFKMNFTCSQKKCQAIVTNVFAPHAKQMLKEDLKQCNYVSIYTDASNHGNVKLFPILLRFFIPTVGVRVKVLELCSEKGETSEIISNLLWSVAREYGLEKKIVAFCGDNAKVNFGGLTRGGENNVFYRMKLWLPHLLGIGCAAHIVHNALKNACDAVPIDVEYIIVKIYSHFYIYTVRTEALKKFCCEADVEYKKLLGYAKTRFLALGPAAKRIVELFDALKLYFDQLPKGEKKIKEFFQKPEAKFWLLFVVEQSELFAETVLKIEGDDVTAIEVVHHLFELEDALKTRDEDNFLSPRVAAEKEKLHGTQYDSDVLDAKSTEFFTDARSYMNSWTEPLKQLKIFAWALLTRRPTWQEIEVVMMTLNTLGLYNASENATILYGQCRYIKNYCTADKIKQWRNDKVSIPNRWVEIFNHLQTENCEYNEIAKLIEYILCLPGTTASVERVFSKINNSWTNEKSKLQIATLKASLMVKCNLGYSCIEFYNFLKTNPELLQQIAATDKYSCAKESDKTIDAYDDDDDDDHDNSSVTF